MAIDSQRARALLKECNLTGLFREELGWDNHRGKLSVPVDGTTHVLHAIAEKRGLAVYHCSSIPDYATRRKIERNVAKSVREHLIVFSDAAKTSQIWQWVKREIGKPDACREHHYHRNQSGDALILKLNGLAVSLDEEEKLTQIDVLGRVRKSLDIEKITKKFYELFQKEKTKFQEFIEGITSDADHAWYTSVMLNRLMFVYFIQKKGFLDGDTDYLRHRLESVQKIKGRDKFQTFYRYFLMRLFKEGLGKREQDRSKDLEKLIGRVPYLNGGIFQEHKIEVTYRETINIPDAAFERVFDFFDKFHWHLDERPLRADDEINPDVLGYIFEKYINQKQMGAYYTKEDITEYISKNCVIPYLFDAAQAKCKVAFEGEQSVWRLPKADPDRYIYDAVRKGCELALPPAIAAGIDDVTKRGDWNKSADDAFALPTEIWREVVARRQRYAEIKAKLAAGEIQSINDFITYNLNIRQFAQDVIENCEGPELLKAIWQAIEAVTILDPTCGSGAFLFAALNVLEPLYEACLDRMEVFLEEEDGPKKFPEFRAVMERINAHPSRKYFVFKTIIVNNLYGVDIMEEAVEICKLRMFLKLAAQVERFEDIEPLPDIDFNVRAGNTLVGFANVADVKRTVAGKLADEDQGNEIAEIEEEARICAMAFAKFRECQTDLSPISGTAAKVKGELQKYLDQLNDKLNKYLAAEYSVRSSEKAKYEKWVKSHQPFHWFSEFYGIMSKGGFCAIVGNPPYIEYSKVKDSYSILGFESIDAGNLYAPVIEQCLNLSAKGTRIGMIVQLSSICTDRMEPLQKLLRTSTDQLFVSCFDDRPAKLFDGLEHIRASIIIGRKDRVKDPSISVTRLIRWHSNSRNELFNSTALHYEDVSKLVVPGSMPKMGTAELKRILARARSPRSTLANICDPKSNSIVYYYRSPLYWIRSMDFLPHFDSGAATRSVHHFKDFHLTSKAYIPIVGCIINSTLFYIWFITYGNGRNVALRDITTFPMPDTILTQESCTQFERLFKRLMADFKAHSVVKKRKDGVEYQEFYPGQSKPIMDEIDRAIATYYGLTASEVDFIVNYDVKYRMGADDAGDDE